MRLIWSDEAIADLDAIHDYIARDSVHYATRVAQQLIAAVEPLESFPHLGRVAPEGDGRHRNRCRLPLTGRMSWPFSLRGE